MGQLLHFSDDKCPVLVYLIWSDGRHRAIFVDCGRWICNSCGPSKLEKIAIRVFDSTLTLDYLYEFRCSSREYDKIRKSLTRKKAATVKFRYQDSSHYIVADSELSGQGWEFAKLPKLDALVNIRQIDHTEVQRHDFTKHWKNEPVLEASKDSIAIYRLNVSSMNDVHRMLGKVDQKYEDEYLADPYEVAEKLRLMNW